MNKLDVVVGLLQRVLNERKEEEIITSISLTKLARRMGWGKEKTRAKVKAAGIRYTEEPVKCKDGVVRNTMVIVEQDLPRLFQKPEVRGQKSEIRVKDMRKEFNKIFEIPGKTAIRQGRSRKAG